MIRQCERVKGVIHTTPSVCNRPTNQHMVNRTTSIQLWTLPQSPTRRHPCEVPSRYPRRTPSRRSSILRIGHMEPISNTKIEQGSRCKVWRLGREPLAKDIEIGGPNITPTTQPSIEITEQNNIVPKIFGHIRTNHPLYRLPKRHHRT